jgi:16S rRNA (uracil1498-N3)-methyltransferase
LPRFDFAAQRLFVDHDLAEGAIVTLGRDQANYLLNVLRLESGAKILVFNGRQGEWLASVETRRKRDAILRVGEARRAQTATGDLRLLFAPLKHARLDYMTQKAVEMGVSHLVPALTRRTQVHRINLDRMRANCVEAAEQCGILSLPALFEPKPLESVLRDCPDESTLIFCDEEAPVRDPIQALADLRGKASSRISVLIGPEGGFDPSERSMLLSLRSATAISLGPRILRADTAAVAALSIVQAVLGDWRTALE